MILKVLLNICNLCIFHNIFIQYRNYKKLNFNSMNKLLKFFNFKCEMTYIDNICFEMEQVMILFMVIDFERIKQNKNPFL